MLPNIIILCLITVSLLFSTVLSSPDEFTVYDLFFISLFLVGTIIIQSTIAYVSRNPLKRPWLTTLYLSECIVFNIYCVNIIFIEDFGLQPPHIKFGLLLLATFIFFMLLRAVNELKNGAVWVPFLILAVSIVDLGPSVFSLLEVQKPSSFDRDDNGGTASPNVRLVDFSKKPNVYIVSFDSLLPRSLAKKHLGLDELAYNDTLEDNFTVFKNMFADYVNTMPALNSFLALDMSYFRSLGDRFRALVPGHAPSPLYQIFKHNGYDTNFIYQTTYFGIKKGQFLDRYHISSRFSACQFVDKNAVFAFFGYCSLQKTQDWARYENLLFSPRATDSDFLIALFEESLVSNKPNVFFSYLYSPGHTPKDYDHSDQRKREGYIEHQKNQSSKTASIIEQIVAFLNEKDEKGILILFSDHGPWLARGMKFEEDPEFVVQDRFGIAGGVYPPNACQNYIEPLLKEPFVTPTRFARAIIQCLADGQDPFISEPGYFLYPQWRLDTSEIRRYEEFLYE